MNDREKQIYDTIENYVFNQTHGEASGHDWWHLYRVKELRLKLAKSEGGDIFICQLSALLHDLIDDKLVYNLKEALVELKLDLQKFGLFSDEIDEIRDIISKMSYRTNLEKSRN